ncbi:MAG: hypothetical protein IKP77_04010 [Acholeplasmatales bacterium]|nr:hypothetical protein [Acholeplasmatales bacterium]
MYTTYGICEISDIIEMSLGGKKNQYYVLHPLRETKTELTLPVDNPMTKIRLHPLLSEGDINDLIHQIPFLDVYWIERDNDRKVQFGDIVKSGDRKETLRLIKCIKYHAHDIKDKGRKLHATDETAMKDAEKLILDEFSYVLGIERDKMSIIINTELEK